VDVVFAATGMEKQLLCTALLIASAFMACVGAHAHMYKLAEFVVWRVGAKSAGVYCSVEVLLFFEGLSLHVL
jgi:hypothetical protein